MIIVIMIITTLITRTITIILPLEERPQGGGEGVHALEGQHVLWEYKYVYIYIYIYICIVIYIYTHT